LTMKLKINLKKIQSRFWCVCFWPTAKAKCRIEHSPYDYWIDCMSVWSNSYPFHDFMSAECSFQLNSCWALCCNEWKLNSAYECWMKIDWKFYSSFESWMKVEWKLTESWMKVEWKLNESWMKVEWKLNESWMKVEWKLNES
jgi:hypothetical protein